MKGWSKTRMSDVRVSEKGGIGFTSGFVDVEVPFHCRIPFERRVLVNEELFAGCGVHIAVHMVKEAERVADCYAQVHSHGVDEINLILGEKGGNGLVYEIRTGREELTVESPQAVYIPRGTPHAAQAARGSGVFVCIVLGDLAEGMGTGQ